MKWLDKFKRKKVEEKRQKTVAVDFDGVIHSYISGWYGAEAIPDPPVPGAIEFLVQATEHFDVCIFSARNCLPGGIQAMKTWLSVWSVGLTEDPEAFVAKLRFPVAKPSATMYIDDRAFKFEGTFPSVEEIQNFKPWVVEVPK